MAFARWDPIRDLLAIQQRLDRFAPDPAGWVPAVDLHETEEHYILTAEIAGLSREDVRIHVQEGRLTLSGVRPESAVPCEQYHRLERGHGEFHRTFQLPQPIDVDGIVADLKDGVLTVSVPKAPSATAHRIRVS